MALEKGSSLNDLSCNNEEVEEMRKKKKKREKMSCSAISKWYMKGGADPCWREQSQT